jgi:hypothetical protein
LIRWKKKSLLRLFTVAPLPSKRQLAWAPKKRDRSALTVTYDAAIVQMLSCANA